jgi:ABC-2 type transport system permease protein
MSPGFRALFMKEVLRFWKVGFQTVAAPVLSALLFLVIFSHALARHVEAYPGVGYTQFLLPGLAMMSMLQNAFANASSSIIQSKITGNIVFILLAPLTPGDLFAAYLLASIVRAVVVGAGVILAVVWLVPVPIPNPFWLAAFAFTGAGILGALGIIAGIWADRFDELAAFQNFIVMPLTFLSGVFYSVQSLPPFWQAASHLNPFFYAIDGFRYAFFGQADVSPWVSLAIASATFCALSWLTLRLLRGGYKLRQ